MISLSTIENYALESLTLAFTQERHRKVCSFQLRQTNHQLSISDWTSSINPVHGAGHGAESMPNH